MNLTYLLFRLSPELTMLITSLAAFFIGLHYSSRFAPRFVRQSLIYFVILGNITSLILYFLVAQEIEVFYYDMLYTAPQSTLFKVFLLLFSTLLLLFLYFPTKIDFRWREIFLLMQMATLALLSSMTTNNFILLYLAIELAAICQYSLSASKDESVKWLLLEGVIKYFYSNLNMSVLLLVAVLSFYEEFSTFNIRIITATSDFYLDSQTYRYIYYNIIAYSVYHLFKASVYPYHLWVADIYENTSPFIAAYFAIVSKMGAFFHVYATLCIFQGHIPHVQFTYWMLGLLSIVIGTFAIFIQTSVQRIFAYSSVSHSGIVLITFSFGTFNSFYIAFFYLVVYSFLTFSFFTVLQSLTNFSGKCALSHINDLPVFKDSDPLLLYQFTFTLLSFSGIPPFLGFFSKVFIVELLILDGFYVTLIIYYICSLFSTAYYVKLIMGSWSTRMTTSFYIHRLTNFMKIIIIVQILLNIFVPLFLIPYSHIIYFFF